MNIILSLLAKLDYPSPFVMLAAVAIMVAFIWGGGAWFKRAEQKAKAERAARIAKAKADATAMNP